MLRGECPAILHSVTSMEGAQVPPSASTSWWAVWILPLSLKTAVHLVRSPLHVQTSPAAVSAEVLVLPWLSKKCRW